MEAAADRTSALASPDTMARLATAHRRAPALSDRRAQPIAFEAQVPSGKSPQQRVRQHPSALIVDLILQVDNSYDKGIYVLTIYGNNTCDLRPRTEKRKCGTAYPLFARGP